MQCLKSIFIILIVVFGLVACAGHKVARETDMRFVNDTNAVLRTQSAVKANYKPQAYGLVNREQYNIIQDNDFQPVSQSPQSTFSIDVDTASYTNIRRIINAGQLPPPDAVRIEEMINYFDYSYPLPANDAPLAIFTEVGVAPWNSNHRIVRLGIQAKNVSRSSLPPSNLVFLIDVSGSMRARLPMVKASLKQMVKKLRAEDSVAIVVYAGAAGLVLPSTPGDQKWKIKRAIDRLYAGGSTAGAQGVELAYQTAFEHFGYDKNNRIILATDGDFNIGPHSQGDLLRLIKSKRDLGVYLTVLGFGSGNLQDGMMEMLADKGNGNYFYIDSKAEAKKVFGSQLLGTLHTVAKDVKVQVEFNPQRVSSYRLIGYENRLLAAQDFNDERKDAGELGVNHSVTALYEIIPVHIAAGVSSTRYFEQRVKPQGFENELMQVKVRYKPEPETEQAGSRLITRIVNDSYKNSPSSDFKFAAAVAEYGMLLRDSQYKESSSYEQVLRLAHAGKGRDKHGYRVAFAGLVSKTRDMVLHTGQW